MVTIIKITDKTIGEVHEMRFTDRPTVHALVDALNTFAEVYGFVDSNEYSIEAREVDE